MMPPVILKCACIALLCAALPASVFASDVKSITLPRSYFPRRDGWFNVNHPFVYFPTSTYSSMVSTMKELPGIASVRVPFHWALLEPSRGNLDSNYLARLDAAIDALNASSIAVVGFFVGYSLHSRTLDLVKHGLKVAAVL